MAEEEGGRGIEEVLMSIVGSGVDRCEAEAGELHCWAEALRVEAEAEEQ